MGERRGEGGERKRDVGKRETERRQTWGGWRERYIFLRGNGKANFD